MQNKQHKKIATLIKFATLKKFATLINFATLIKFATLISLLMLLWSHHDSVVQIPCHTYITFRALPIAMQ